MQIPVTAFLGTLLCVIHKTYSVVPTPRQEAHKKNKTGTVSSKTIVYPIQIRARPIDKATIQSADVTFHSGVHEKLKGCKCIYSFTLIYFKQVVVCLYKFCNVVCLYKFCNVDSLCV